LQAAAANEYVYNLFINKMERAEWMLKLTGKTLSVLRLWISAETTKTVQNALKQDDLSRYQYILAEIYRMINEHIMIMFNYFSIISQDMYEMFKSY